MYFLQLQTNILNDLLQNTWQAHTNAPAPANSNRVVARILLTTIHMNSSSRPVV